MEIAIPVPQGWHRLSRTNYGRGGPAEGRCAGARLSLQDLKSFLNLHQELKRWAKLVAFAAEYVSLWRHSGHWLFDSPEILRNAARGNSITLDGTSLFYYEGKSWNAYEFTTTRLVLLRTRRSQVSRQWHPKCIST